MILATSPLVGSALADLTTAHEVRILPFRSEAWNAALPEARALLVLLSEPLTPEDLDRAPLLRAVATYSVGFNHLPVTACEARGIRVVNTPGTLTDATADLALALLLALTRRVAEGEALVRSGQWRGWAPDQLLGLGLRNRTCGILGAGAIGRAFATRVWALGMDVAFWDREGRGGTVDFGPGSARRLPLATLLAESSVVSLHCPLTADTTNLLDASKLRAMAPGAVLINTARGGIFDEPAAIQLLHEGHLGGVGLDVYAGEPALDPRWLKAPRTVLLPHLGSATVETRAAMARQVCDGIRAALEN
ncbi:MAG TPA: NAD(P)-dependent oxidoreductase [Holophagaceae bacterium]|nr:NAD(P)-dependent oxidoreductase [Holophagaceae bacterium]